MRELARLEHESWMNGQKLAGWRRGAPRDERRRFHEFLVPFDALSSAVQAYDYEQVRVVAEKVVREADADAVTVFRERRIGIFADDGLSEATTEAALRDLSERALPQLLARFEGDWLTLVTRLLLGPELLLCERVISALEARGRRAWRLIVVQAVPDRILLRSAAGAGMGDGQARQDVLHAEMMARRLQIIACPETEHIVDLTPPALRLEDWLKDPALQRHGEARARDYLWRKCEVVIAAQAKAVERAGLAPLADLGAGQAGDRVIRLLSA
jgi:hypothetical protein